MSQPDHTPGAAERIGCGPSEGTHFIHFTEIDSTNSEAMRRALVGEEGPLWITADRQLGGRGRSGRSWTSEPGNLHASLMLVPGCGLPLLPQLSLVAGIAAIDAVREAAGPGAHDPVLAGLRLKWPNDLIVGTAKLGGILAESVSRPYARLPIAIVGIGLNLSHHPRELERAATHLSELRVTIGPQQMLRHLAGRMQHWLGVWQSGQGFAQIREAWLARGTTAGEPISVKTGAGLVAGTFAGLAEDGALLLRDTGGAVMRYKFGDVALLPLADRF